MINTKAVMTLEEKIKETMVGIKNTKSRQRKYELHRHLDKLIKQQRKEKNGKANRI